LWFNGSEFVATDFYVENGRLTHHPSTTEKSETIDLPGRYVVPPYDDAHEHNFDNVSRTLAVTAKYLRDGIFYAQGMTDVTSGAAKVVAAGLVDTPETIDVTYAHGGLTAIDGHPKEVYESLANGFYYPSTPAQKEIVIGSHLQAGDAYWEVDSATDLAAKWPNILAVRPDLIKIYLSDSEEYAADSHMHPQLGKGRDPNLVPLITALAHRAGLRVAAHVDTATDVHVAVIGGVDELGHLPGYCMRAGDDPTRLRITDADVGLLARHHVAVQATAGIYTDDTTPPLDKAARRASQIDNLSRLQAAGVVILIGSDHYGEDSTHEADYLQSLGLWSNAEMLRMWSMSTPKSIFPRRKIAALQPEFEASFLILSNDPLKQWDASHSIVDRWKCGHHIVPLGSANTSTTGPKNVQTRDSFPLLESEAMRNRLSAQNKIMPYATSRSIPRFVPAGFAMPVPGPAQTTSVLTGEVLQENGKPVSDAEVSRFWVLGTPDGNGARAYAGTHTDVTGHFSLPIKQEDLPADLIVYTNDRRQAAIAHVETAASPVTISLQPVQRLHLNARAPQLGGSLNGTRFLLQTTTGAPLAQLFGNEVDVPFPLGDYRLSLSSADTLTTMRTIHVAIDMPSSLHITLALSAMARHFGKKPQQLDTALIDSQGRPFVFRKIDRPTLLYFWADWCEPCIAEGIPHLLQFASLHKGDRF
jgi:imidazolonepropionase-like amidohydrolase/thiol-disulfide isomerase/thioredoxin